MSLYLLEPSAVELAKAADKRSVLDAVAALVARTYALDGDAVREALDEREALGSTGFGRGVAIPHARLPGIKRPVAVVLKLDEPVDFASADGLPVGLVFGLVSPEEAGVGHLHALAAISRLSRDDAMREAMMAAPDANALFCLVSDPAERHAA